MLADIDEKALEEKSKDLSREFSPDVVRTTLCNVTDEKSVSKAIEQKSNYRALSRLRARLWVYVVML